MKCAKQKVRYVCFLNLVQCISPHTKFHLSTGGKQTKKKKQLRNIHKASELIFSIELKQKKQNKQKNKKKMKRRIAKT